MKQTLLAILAIAVFASCEQKTNDKAAHNNDVALVNTHSEPKSIDSFLITQAYADSMIQHYHKNLVEIIGIDSFRKHTQNLSFMIDANMLRQYLNENPDISMLDIYLAQKLNNGKMTLVYIGAKTKDENGVNKYEEMVINKDGVDKVLDHVYPCPTCETRIQAIGGLNGVNK